MEEWRTHIHTYIHELLLAAHERGVGGVVAGHEALELVRRQLAHAHHQRAQALAGEVVQVLGQLGNVPVVVRRSQSVGRSSRLLLLLLFLSSASIVKNLHQRPAPIVIAVAAIIVIVIMITIVILIIIIIAVMI